MLHGIFLQNVGSDLFAAFFLLAMSIIVAAVIIRIRAGRARQEPVAAQPVVNMESVDDMIRQLMPSIQNKILENIAGRIKTAEDEMNQKLDARLNTSMANVTDESRQMVKKMVAEAGESVRDDAISFLNRNSVKREEFERLAERVESELGADEIAERIGLLAELFTSSQIKILNWQCRLVKLLRGGLAPDAEEDTMMAEGIPKNMYAKFLNGLIGAGVVSKRQISAFYLESEFEWIYSYVENPDFLRSRLANQERHKNLEKDYHEYVKNNPHLVEEGLRVQESQYRLDTGPIDLMCRDSNDRPVGVELKYPASTKAVLRQIGGYRAEFIKKTGVGNSRFIVVSPSIPKSVEDLLREHGVEMREIPFDHAGKEEKPPAPAMSETVQAGKNQSGAMGVLPKPDRRYVLNSSGEPSKEERDSKSAV